MTDEEKAYTKKFKKIIEERGWIYIKSTDDEDRYDHFDCHVCIIENGFIVRKLKIELKGRKYSSKGNRGIPKEERQYIEFMNVSGEIGWLFGEADYIAVEGDGEMFYIIDRQDMIKFSEKLFKVDLSKSISNIEKQFSRYTWVHKPTHHELYRRYKRKDLVTMISMDEVKSLAKCIFKGDNTCLS
jgi:hypothetical protein